MTTNKYKITIKHIIDQNYEFVLSSNSLIEALDEARKLVAKRNSKNKIGTYFVAKINTIINEE